MKQCKSCGLEKQLDQFHNSKASADGKQYNCKSCECKRSASWYARNKDKAVQLKKAYRDANKELIAQRKREYRAENYEEVKKREKTHQENNLHIYAKNSSKRRAKLANATPAWLTEDDDFIFNEIYEMRDIRSKDTGVIHHVDHIIPLQGEEACGLHVWWNLQLLPASENISKSNKVGGI
jgi:sugar-specific transcriptional regulator TrmB